MNLFRTSVALAAAVTAVLLTAAPPLAAQTYPDRPIRLVVGVGGDTAVPIPRVDRAGRSLGVWKREDVVQRSGAGSAPTWGGSAGWPRNMACR